MGGIVTEKELGAPLPEECPRHKWKREVGAPISLCPGCRADIEAALKRSNGALPPAPPEAVAHPAHYGGKDNPYEAIKVIEAWDLGFCLGNTVKYICRAGKKSALLEDLKKARWYLDREIARLEPPAPKE